MSRSESTQERAMPKEKHTNRAHMQISAKELENSSYARLSCGRSEEK